MHLRVVSGFCMPLFMFADSVPEPRESFGDSFSQAQSTAQGGTPPTPCATEPEARRFDFWLGEWDVRVAQGQLVGRSSIELVSGGCALLENWTSLNGATGKSLNAYNRSLGRWQQFWVGQLGQVTEYRDSEWRGTSLVFRASNRSGDGTSTLVRLTFTPLPNGVVRQFSEQSADNGKTWTTQYEFFYHRRQG